MRHLTTALAALVTVVAAAGADTFTNSQTGERLEGKLLGTTTRDGERLLIAKLSGRIRLLPAREWRAKREGTTHGETATPAANPPGTSDARPAYAWPELIYQGKPRQAQWLQKAYDAFGAKIGLIDGKYYSLCAIDIWESIVARKVQFLAYARGGRTHFAFEVGPKTRGQLSGPIRLNVGDCCLVSGKVLQVIGDDAVILDADSQDRQLMRVKRVSTQGIVDGKYWHGIVIAVGTYRYMSVSGAPRTILDCQPAPKERHALSREQFVDAIRQGVRLAVCKLERGRTPTTVISRAEGKLTEWRYELRCEPID